MLNNKLPYTANSAEKNVVVVMNVFMSNITFSHLFSYLTIKSLILFIKHCLPYFMSFTTYMVTG